MHIQVLYLILIAFERLQSVCITSNAEEVYTDIASWIAFAHVWIHTDVFHTSSSCTRLALHV